VFEVEVMGGRLFPLDVVLFTAFASASLWAYAVLSQLPTP
jgi:hypothetical protein